MATNQYGTQVESLRMRAGLLQIELASALGYQREEISRYESGLVRPRPARYRRIIEYLEAVISGDSEKTSLIANGDAA